MGKFKKMISDFPQFVAKIFWILMVSLVATGVVATATAGTAYADTADAEKALEQLMKDISSLQDDFEEPVMTSQNGYYKTRLGDTLSQIIQRTVPNVPVRKKILQQAIVRANPHAFKRSNPNWMFAGRKLKLPDAADIHKVIFTDAAGKSTKKSSHYDERDGWVSFP
ncbi:LysM peptidoglycan-binding domain-containing protein [Porticoccaceae bacterium]|jgi:Tfp pilus assembly protein FimV|nr:LysM peptidoglycan-binding domain-containing protein [Porticoccaceae bacterium]